MRETSAVTFSSFIWEKPAKILLSAHNTGNKSRVDVKVHLSGFSAFLLSQRHNEKFTDLLADFVYKKKLMH